MVILPSALILGVVPLGSHLKGWFHSYCRPHLWDKLHYVGFYNPSIHEYSSIYSCWRRDGRRGFYSICMAGQSSQKKTVDTLIVDNSVGFIPDQIKGLLKKTFIWSVSFSENTID